MLMRVILASVAVLILAGFAGADDPKPIETKMLVGKWELPKPNAQAPTAFLEISEKNTFTITAQIGDKTGKIEGTYTVKGRTIEVSFTGADKQPVKETITVIELNDKIMKTQDAKGKEETLTKVAK